MIYTFMFDFFKNNYINYIFYFISLSNIPMTKIGMPHLYGKLIGSIKQTNIDGSFKLLVILILCWFFIQCVIMLSHYIRAKILPLFSSYIRKRMMDEIIERYKMKYEEIEIGDTLTKIIKAPWLAEDIFYITEDFIFRNIVIIVSSFLYLFYYNRGLGYIYIVGMICIVIICYFFVNDCTKYIDSSERIYDKTHSEIEDTLSNLMSVYTSRKTEYEKTRISEFSDNIYHSEKAIMKCNTKYRFMYSLIFLGIFMCLNLYSYRIFRTKQITVEVLISIIIINYSLLSTFMTIYYDTKKFLDIKARVDVFRQYIDSLPDRSQNNKINIRDTKNIDITFKNVEFYYKKDKNILKNINLKISKNEIVAIMGHIGSGKSTLAKLIVRLIEHQKGEIFIKNTEIKRINIDSLRENITYIPQHPKLFNRTLFDNIMYGVNGDIKEKKIYQLLESLSIPDTYKKLKNMMYKSVGKNGSLLSGGQRQIVWLVRSILKNSRIIILDEPTSSLDENSKKQVIRFIQRFSKNRIIIIITHDSSLIKYSTRVIKLQNGEIIKDKKIT